MPTLFRVPVSSRFWPGRGVRLGVVLILLLGTLMSALGGLQTHGLGLLDGAAPQAEQRLQVDAHGHSHDDDLSGHLEPGAHTHLGADHSHDKAHALPAGPVLPPALAPLSEPRAPTWLARLAWHRLDRPPKAA